MSSILNILLTNAGISLSTPISGQYLWMLLTVAKQTSKHRIIVLHDENNKQKKGCALIYSIHYYA